LIIYAAYATYPLIPITTTMLASLMFFKFWNSNLFSGRKTNFTQKKHTQATIGKQLGLNDPGNANASCNYYTDIYCTLKVSCKWKVLHHKGRLPRILTKNFQKFSWVQIPNIP